MLFNNWPLIVSITELKKLHMIKLISYFDNFSDAETWICQNYVITVVVCLGFVLHQFVILQDIHYHVRKKVTFLPLGKISTTCVCVKKW